MPQPPALGPGEVRVANVFVDYHSDGRNADEYPLQETAAQARTGSMPGRIPRTLARLRAGGPVTIVCWGDSVTVGGDASSPEMRYAAVFERRLREKYPVKIDDQALAQVRVKAPADGGTER